jgi:predicted dehydrogenase
MNIVLIGAGKWGKNYISTLSNFSNVNLQIANRDNWKKLIDDKPDGVIISTPPQSHIEIACHSLSLGIPIMIEKPLSLSLSEALVLKQFKAPILVNHIHLFSVAYQNLRDFTHSHKIDKIVSFGVNNSPDRDYSSLWDYGCHDIAMILDLAQEFPHKIKAEQIETERGALFKIKLKFKTFETESYVGNSAEKSVRKIKVSSDGLNIKYNDNKRPSNQAPPLTMALFTFIKAIEGNKDYRLGLDLSLKVLQVLESCEKSLTSYN